MPHRWPEDTDFALLELDVIDRNCPVCGHLMYMCDHRHRHFFTLDGPVHLVSKLNHCPDPRCPGHCKTKSPEIEPTIALRGRGIALRDVFCWIGHRRFSRHASIPQIRADLHDTFAIDLAVTGIANYIDRYQAMLAACQQDPEAAMRRLYHGTDSLILSIDGLQPEKGHETLYVVRELTGKRVWFAEALLSATADEVRRLIAQAKQWAEGLGKSVALWISDKQDAFVTGIAAEFPAVPHRYCDNHFLRDLAKPVLEADSHAKVQMRKKVRGLRGIEQSVLTHRRGSTPVGPPPPPPPESGRDRDPRQQRIHPPSRMIQWATWSWTTVPRFAGSSTMTRAVHSTRPGCEWPTRWARCGSRSNGTGTRKKGIRGEATEPAGRLHRQGIGPGETPTEGRSGATSRRSGR